MTRLQMTVLPLGRFGSVAEPDRAGSKKQVSQSREEEEEEGWGGTENPWPCRVPRDGSWVPPATLALPVTDGRTGGAISPALPATGFLALRCTSQGWLGFFLFFFPFFPLIREAFNKKLKFVNHFV